MVRILEPWEAALADLDPLLTPNKWAKERRKKHAGLDAGLVRGHGWRRTHNDSELLNFLARFTVISTRQAAKFFYGGSYETARQRIRKMTEAGLLTRDDTISWCGTIVWPTRTGLRAAHRGGLRYEAALRPSESQLLHRLLVTEEAAKLVTSGIEVFSEREIRILERRDPDERMEALIRRGVKVIGNADSSRVGVLPSLVTETTGAGSSVQRQRILAAPTKQNTNKPSIRYPDLVEVTPNGELRAIEMEIIDKEPARLRAIVDGYRDCGPHVAEKIVDDKNKRVIMPRQFRQVRWLCTPSVQRTLLGINVSAPSNGTRASLGMIRDSYAAGNKNIIGRTDGIYVARRKLESGKVVSAPVAFDENGWAKGRPMGAELIAEPDDEGIAWRLAQHFVADSRQCGLSEWPTWRKIWRDWQKSVGQEVPYYLWINMREALDACVKETR